MILQSYDIIGVSALLLHNAAGLVRKTGINAPIPSPEVEAEKGAYRNERGELYLPSFAFRSCMIGRGGGCTGRKLGKRSANAVIAASVFLTEMETVLLDGKGKPIKDYKVYTCRAVVQGQGILRSRPMIEKWNCVVTFELDEMLLGDGAAKLVLELLNISGKIAGVGDFRPQCKGMFGRFKAEIHKQK